MVDVVVYGTLMQGMGNSRWLDRFNYTLEKGKISNFSMYDVGSFPALVRGFYSYDVEVLHFDQTPEEVFSHLDQLEGCHNNDKSSLYIREEIPVQVESGEISATVYMWNRSVSNLSLIEPMHKDYRNFVAFKKGLA